MWRFAIVLVACAQPPEHGSVEQGLTTEVRHARLTTIRDTAADMGMYNAALLGGIAVSETQLAHCASEVGFGCPGPASPSCGGNPVIAGGADGPCSAMQGGLGMFQFDAGTYAQTLATYGDAVLTVEGNSALAVNFVVGRTELDIAGVTDWRSSTAWMNAVPMDQADPVMQQWAQLLACRYNGCCSTSTTCTTRANGYRDNALAVYSEMGAEFWATAGRCAQVPADGVIDQRTACYVAAGDPRSWRHEAVGYGDSSEWTNTQTAAAPSNYAEWHVHANRAAMLQLAVYLDGGVHGQSTHAAYHVVHGGQDDVVVLDQTSATGFTKLGDFMFTGEGDEYVTLGDATDDPAPVPLLFDALQVIALDGGGLDPPPKSAGGCTIGGGNGGWLTGGLLLWLRRRRRNPT